MNPNDFSDIVVNPPAPTTWRDYFTSKYFFETPPQATRLYIPLIILFGLMVALAIVLKIFGAKEAKKITSRFFYLFATCGILGYLYVFARYEGLPWFSVRFFFALIILAFGVWAIWNSVWTIKYLSKSSDQQKKTDRFEKYLPKNKAKA